MGVGELAAGLSRSGGPHRLLDDGIGRARVAQRVADGARPGLGGVGGAAAPIGLRLTDGCERGGQRGVGVLDERPQALALPPPKSPSGAGVDAPLGLGGGHLGVEGLAGGVGAGVQDPGDQVGVGRGQVTVAGRGHAARSPRSLLVGRVPPTDGRHRRSPFAGA